VGRQLFKRLGIVLKPNPEVYWERFEVFNPGVVYDKKEGIVHMFYRAIGDYLWYTSRIGWAISEDFIHFKRVSKEPILYPTNDKDWFGVEDPRVTEIDGKGYVMTYTSLDKRRRYRVGIAVAKKLEGKEPFRKLGVNHISKNKDAAMFRANGHIYVAHRPEKLFGRPSIWISKVEDSKLNIWKEHKLVLRPVYEWENFKVGLGPPPILTEEGYLVIYHGVQRPKIYRVGLALLSKRNPREVIARVPYPVMEPKEWYERYLDVPFVVFPTGAILVDDELYLYYGAGDTVIALAKARIDELLYELDKNRVE